ncbi:MAG: T9SS type A sorting domain-containing protein [Bacteroidota bacterium]
MACYFPTGELYWAMGSGGSGSIEATTIFDTSSGYKAVAGHYSGFVEFATMFGSDTTTAVGDDDFFLLLVNDDGDVLDSYFKGGPGKDQITSITETLTGRLVLGGCFEQSVVLDPINDIVMNADGREGFILYFDPIIVDVENSIAPDWSVQIHPNPVQENLQIAWENIPISADVQLRIFDARGQLVISRKGITPQLNVQELSAGTYVLEVAINGERQRQQLIKF